MLELDSIDDDKILEVNNVLVEKPRLFEDEELRKKPETGETTEFPREKTDHKEGVDDSFSLTSKKVDRFKCRFCKKSYIHIGRLNYHMKVKHGETVGQEERMNDDNSSSSRRNLLSCNMKRKKDNFQLPENREVKKMTESRKPVNLPPLANIINNIKMVPVSQKKFSTPFRNSTNEISNEDINDKKENELTEGIDLIEDQDVHKPTTEENDLQSETLKKKEPRNMLGNKMGSKRARNFINLDKGKKVAESQKLKTQKTDQSNLAEPLVSLWEATRKKFPELTKEEMKLCLKTALSRERELNPGSKHVKRGLIWEEVKTVLHEKSAGKTDEHKEEKRDETSNMTITTQITTNENDGTIWSNEMDNTDFGTNNIDNISSQEDILKDDLPLAEVDEADISSSEKKKQMCEDSQKNGGDTSILMQSGKCKFCGKMFQHIGVLIKHMEKKHLNPKPEPLLKCFKCNKIFKTKKTLKYHMKTHNNDNLVVCEICGENFVSKYKLSVHIRNSHTKLYCDRSNCGFEGTAAEVERHKHCKHRSGKSSVEWTCEICGKHYKSRKGVFTHKKNHKMLEDVLKKNPNSVPASALTANVEITPTFHTLVNVSMNMTNDTELGNVRSGHHDESISNQTESCRFVPGTLDVEMTASMIRQTVDVGDYWSCLFEGEKPAVRTLSFDDL